MYLNRNGKILVGSVGAVFVLVLLGLGIWGIIVLAESSSATSKKSSSSSAIADGDVIFTDAINHHPNLQVDAEVENLWDKNWDLIKSRPDLQEACTNLVGESAKIIHGGMQFYPSKYHSTTVSVLNEDCINLAIDKATAGLRVALVSFANNSAPPSDYKFKKCPGQEQEIFRRTTLAYALDENLRLEGDTRVKSTSEIYPISLKDFDHAGVLTEDVLALWKKTSPNHYSSIESPAKINVISVPPIKKSEQPHFFNSFNSSFTGLGTLVVKSRIELQFMAALKCNADVLILGAFGCGEAQNDPAEIAKIYLNVIRLYRHSFKEILFAIPKEYGQYEFYQFSKILEPLF